MRAVPVWHLRAVPVWHLSPFGTSSFVDGRMLNHRERPFLRQSNLRGEEQVEAWPGPYYHPDPYQTQSPTKPVSPDGARAAATASRASTPGCAPCAANRRTSAAPRPMMRKEDRT